MAVVPGDEALRAERERVRAFLKRKGLGPADGPAGGPVPKPAAADGPKP